MRTTKSAWHRDYGCLLSSFYSRDGMHCRHDGPSNRMLTTCWWACPGARTGKENFYYREVHHLMRSFKEYYNEQTDITR